MSEIIIPELEPYLECDDQVKWTDEEEEAMRRYYPALARQNKTDLLAEQLGRSRGEIQSKAVRMGLAKRREKDPS
jgi:hypothetical protein